MTQSCRPTAGRLNPGLFHVTSDNPRDSETTERPEWGFFNKGINIYGPSSSVSVGHFLSYFAAAKKKRRYRRCRARSIRRERSTPLNTILFLFVSVDLGSEARPKPPLFGTDRDTIGCPAMRRDSPERGPHMVTEIGRLLRGSGKVQKGLTPASRHALRASASASNSKGAFRYPCAAICLTYS